MVRVTRFSPADPEVEKAIKELNGLLVDSAIKKTTLMPQNDNTAIRNISIVKSNESKQTDSVKTMATAADALGSIAIDATHLTMSVTDPTAWATAMNNLGMVPVGLAGQQLVSVEQIVAVFNASSRQKAWDHFSKAQRKNIDIWRKHCEELRNAHSELLMGIRREEEMEMSDDDSNDIPNKRVRVDESALAVQAYALKEENDSLRWQLDAYRNEVELLKQEKGHHIRTEESLTKDQQLQFLQQTIQNMQQQLTAMQEELNAKKTELEKAKDEQTHAHALVTVLKEQLKSAKEATEASNQEYLSKENNTVSVAVYNHDKEKDAEKQRQSLKSEKEALLIGIISTFLNVHPFGANTEYLWSYLQQLDSRNYISSPVDLIEYNRYGHVNVNRNLEL
ncbi:hypothetical protein GDO86_004195 [Hymenochirus boettgeri]|uniref:Ecto-NOX disulfide-thiol exchanger 1/2 domain-containing protein n=1 Tax=Hymenochirus boettgeri TaxID=247094 RepID=A0A8T2K8V0_9PIPI|nr:hypothetical protein GDO86_004195 [Hymenochirus boettgeri]